MLQQTVLLMIMCVSLMMLIQQIMMLLAAMTRTAMSSTAILAVALSRKGTHTLLSVVVQRMSQTSYH